jgi:hypothetical protein
VPKRKASKSRTSKSRASKSWALNRFQPHAKKRKNKYQQKHRE